MGLKEQAAQLAQQQGRTERTQQQASWNALVKKVEDHVTQLTGIPATFIEQVDVAKVEQKGGGYSFEPRYKVVEYSKKMLVRVDDVDLLVATNDYRGASSGLTVALGAKDPEHGWYKPAEYHNFYLLSTAKNEPDEVRTEKFVRDLALAQRRATRDHPVVQLRKEHKTCPTCGRGY